MTNRKLNNQTRDYISSLFKIVNRTRVGGLHK